MEEHVEYDVASLNGDLELILTHVPEAEFLSYRQARRLAYDRDQEAVSQLFLDIEIAHGWVKPETVQIAEVSW